MTQEEFCAFYPQFAGFTPAAVMAVFVAQANGRFFAFSPVDAEEARRLYTAHKLTMYARTALPGEPPATAGGDGADARCTYAQLAAAGQVKARIAGKKAGEVSVTYASGTSSAFSVSAGLEELTETDYGMQLLALMKLYSRPVYVP